MIVYLLKRTLSIIVLIRVITLRNHLTGALLYYSHACQRTDSGDASSEAYEGTSKSAEAYLAEEVFNKAKNDGVEIEVHWQDEDSSSSNLLI